MRRVLGVAVMFVAVSACEARSNHPPPPPYHQGTGGAGGGPGGGAGSSGSGGALVGAGGAVFFPSCAFTELQVNYLACALGTEGDVACWGAGPVGDGKKATSTFPVAVLGLTDAISIGGGAGHACAVRSGGTVVCWGHNSRGQLGVGGTEDSDVPVQVAVLNDALAVAKGGALFHTCVLRKSGQVACWGAGEYGALGSGSFGSIETPADLYGVSDAVQVAVGHDHGCVVHAAGQVSCWGHGAHALGLGFTDTFIYVTPQKVVGLEGATEVAVGHAFACALRAGGEVWCWGIGHVGQLGGGVFIDTQPTAAPVPGLKDVVHIAATDQAVCAIKKPGSVVCWGRDDAVPGAGFEGVNAPVEVDGITDAVEIAVGAAVTKSKGLVSWGTGILGDGTWRTKYTAPVGVACGPGCGGTDPTTVLEAFTSCPTDRLIQVSSMPGLSCAKVCCSLGFPACLAAWSRSEFGCEALYHSPMLCGEVFGNDAHECVCAS